MGAGVIVAALLGGCDQVRKGGPALAGRHDAPVAGHVYIAQLATSHPLYDDLARLDGAARSLAHPEAPIQVPELRVAESLQGEYIAGPLALRWAQEAWAARQQEAGRRAVQAPVSAATELPADLEAKLNWKKLQAQRQAAQELLRAQGAASRELAKLASDTYRDNQERLGSLAAPGQDDHQSPDSIRMGLEADLARARRQQEELLKKLEMSLLASTDAKVSEAERAAHRQAEARLSPPVGAAAQGLGELMIERMAAVERRNWPQQVQVRMPDPQLPAGSSDPRAELDRIEQQRRLARKLLADQLAARQTQITDRILWATRLAVEKVARDQGIRLQYSPISDATGPDLTTRIRADIQELWSTQEG